MITLDATNIRAINAIHLTTVKQLYGYIQRSCPSVDIVPDMKSKDNSIPIRNLKMVEVWFIEVLNLLRHYSMFVNEKSLSIVKNIMYIHTIKIYFTS